jgi:hypothetical protein
MHPYDNFKLSGAGGMPGHGGLGIPGSTAEERYEDRNYQYDKQRQSFHEPIDDKEVRSKLLTRFSLKGSSQGSIKY